MNATRLKELKSRFAAAEPEGRHWIPRTVPLHEITLGALHDMRTNGLTRDLDNSSRRGPTSGRNPVAAWNLLWPLLGPLGRSIAEEDHYGNPDSTTIGNGVARYSKASLEYAYMVERLAAALPPPTPREPCRIVEIGGGYGGLAKAIARAWNPAGIEMTIYDLAAAAIVQVAYLEATLGFAISTEREHVLPIRVLPWQEIADHPSRTADLVVSTRCLFELELERVDWYLREIHRVLVPGGVFYSVARPKISDPDQWNTEGFSREWDRPWPCDANPAFRQRLYRRSQ